MKTTVKTALTLLLIQSLGAVLYVGWYANDAAVRVKQERLDSYGVVTATADAKCRDSVSFGYRTWAFYGQTEDGRPVKVPDGVRLTYYPTAVKGDKFRLRAGWWTHAVWAELVNDGSIVE